MNIKYSWIIIFFLIQAMLWIMIIIIYYELLW